MPMYVCVRTCFLASCLLVFVCLHACVFWLQVERKDLISPDSSPVPGRW